MSPRAHAPHPTLGWGGCQCSSRTSADSKHIRRAASRPDSSSVRRCSREPSLTAKSGPSEVADPLPALVKQSPTRASPVRLSFSLAGAVAPLECFRHLTWLRVRVQPSSLPSSPP